MFLNQNEPLFFLILNIYKLIVEMLTGVSNEEILLNLKNRNLSTA